MFGNEFDFALGNLLRQGDLVVLQRDINFNCSGGLGFSEAVFIGVPADSVSHEFGPGCSSGRALWLGGMKEQGKTSPVSKG